MNFSLKFQEHGNEIGRGKVSSQWTDFRFNAKLDHIFSHFDQVKNVIYHAVKDAVAMLKASESSFGKP